MHNLVNFQYSKRQDTDYLHTIASAVENIVGSVNIRTSELRRRAVVLKVPESVLVKLPLERLDDHPIGLARDPGLDRRADLVEIVHDHRGVNHHIIQLAGHVDLERRPLQRCLGSSLRKFQGNAASVGEDSRVGIILDVCREGLPEFTLNARHIIDRHWQCLLQKTLQEFVAHLEGNGEGGRIAREVS